MSKKYTDLKPMIIDIIIESDNKVKTRLEQEDCQIKTSHDAIINLGYEGEYLSSVLSAIVKTNKNKEIHPKYQSDIKNIEVFLEKITKDESLAYNHNEKTEQVRDLVISEIESNRDNEIKKLSDNASMYRVFVNTSKLTKDQVLAVNESFKQEGFEKFICEPATWCYFDGLFKGSAETLHDNVLSIIPNSFKEYMKDKVEVQSISYKAALEEELEKARKRNYPRMR